MAGLAKDLMGVGLPAEQALRLGTGTLATVTTAGTSATTATAITSRNNVLVTASSQTGAILPSTAELNQPYGGYNSTSTTAVLYPHTGGNFAGGSTDVGVNVTQGKTFVAQRVSSTVWTVIVGA